MKSLIESLESRRMLAGRALESSMDLWSVDSTGAQLAKLIPEVSDADQMIVFDGSLFVRDFNTIWQTDGTVDGTKRLIGMPGITRTEWMGVADGKLYFNMEAYDSTQHESYGYLYAMESAEGSPRRFGMYGNYSPRISNGKLYTGFTRYLPYSYTVHEIRGTTLAQLSGYTLPAADPLQQVEIPSVPAYASDDGTHGSELWIADDSGGHLAQDIFPGEGSSSPHNIIQLGDHYVFIASTPRAPSGSINIAGDTLYIAGASLADTISITSANGTTTISITHASGFNDMEASFDDGAFAKIFVRGDTGDDLIQFFGIDKPATILGEEGNDTLHGGSGDDTFDGGLGADELDGGAGRDTLDYSSYTQNLTGTFDQIFTSVDETDHFLAMERLLCGKGNDKIYIFRSRTTPGLPYISEIFGGAGDDALSIRNEIAGSPVDILHGGNGNDRLSIIKWGVLDHAGGAVYLYGDAGNDRFIMGSSAGNHQVFGGDGQDRIDYSAVGTVPVTFDDLQNDGLKNRDNVHSDVELTDFTPDVQQPPPQPPLPPSVVVNATLQGGLFNVVGTGGDDVILVRRRPSNLKMLEAIVNGVPRSFRLSDIHQLRIDAAAGNDTISFDPSVGNPTFSTVLIGGDDNDIIYGSAGADRIYGNAGDDWLSGLGGNDTLFGDDGDDKLYGGDGKDYLHDVAGINVFRAGNGTDRIVATIGLSNLKDNKGDLLTLLYS